MYALIKAFLFRREPERIHYWVMRQLDRGIRYRPVRRLIGKYFVLEDKRLERTLWGLTFRNPVGLAAGFDKDARYTDALAQLGFGFIEIGTLTPKAQPGNPQPRLFRLPEDKALINRMGFNNEGVDAAAARLKSRHNNLIIGGNIGKNKITSNEDAIRDYEYCFRALYDTVDYFTVNVSSPNTPGLRALQDKEPLRQLLVQLQKLNAGMEREKPILLKIAPDLTHDQLDEIIDIVQETAIHGIVATNTTTDREGLSTAADRVAAIGAGGLSGLPVKEKATAVIRYIHQKSKGKIPVIAVGGIFTAADALEKLQAGAALVQVYTGFIYEGPAIAKNICTGILEAEQS